MKYSRLFFILIVVLCVCKNADAQWEGAVFDSVPTQYNFAELIERATCLDTSVNLHIIMRESYYKRSISYISRNRVGEWCNYECLVENGSKWRNSRLVFNSTYNTLHFLLQDRRTDTNYVYHYHRNALGWQSELIDSGYFQHGKPDIAIDSSGYIHISWSENDYDTATFIWTNRIFYAHNTSGSFEVQNISGDRQRVYGGAGRVDTYIAVEPDGRAHIREGFYYDIHWVNDAAFDTNWSADTLIMTFGDTLRETLDMKSDSEGNIHLLAYSYRDENGPHTNYRALYFVRSPSATAWTPNHPGLDDIYPACFIPISSDAITIFYANVPTTDLNSAIYSSGTGWQTELLLDNSHKVYPQLNVLRLRDSRYALVYYYKPYILDPGYLKYYGPVEFPADAYDDEVVDILLPSEPCIISYPNPFNGQVTIEIEADIFLSRRQCVVGVRNILGELVRVIFTGRLEHGINYLVWDALDEADAVAASGIYFLTLETDYALWTHKMALVK